MGLKDWLLHKLGGQRKAYSFVDDDRETSLELRRIKRDITKLKAERERIRMQDELDSLKEELGYFDNDEEEGEDTGPLDFDINRVISNFALDFAKSKGLIPEQRTTEQTSSKVELTDEQIKEYLKLADKKDIKNLQKYPEQAMPVLKERYPNVSDKSLVRVLEIAKTI